MTPAENIDRLRDEQRQEVRLTAVISKVLIVGLLVALGLLVIGVILTLMRPDVPLTHTTSVKEIPAQLAALDPSGFFQLGLLVLLATPFARVVALAVAYAGRRQWLFAGISVSVAAMLVAGAILGLSLG